MDWSVSVVPGTIEREPSLFDPTFSAVFQLARNGSSGAPLFTKKGIVGIIIRDEGTRVVALSIEVMKEVVAEEWKYPWGLCPPPIPIPPPEIKRFTIEPSWVTADDEVRLTWEVEGADTVTITPSIGTVNNLKGSLDVSAPTKDTVYTLVAENKGGQTEQSIEVTVKAPPVAEGATIAGKIHYNGGVITKYSDAHAILPSFYSLELLKDVPVDFRYDNQTGEFVFMHVLPGKYRVCIYIDSGYPFASHSPGDFYGCVGGLNDDIVVHPGVTEATWNYKVVHRIHLIEPVNNEQLRTSVGDQPETLYGSGFLPFVWKPVPEASYYEIRLLLKDADTNEEVESRSETVTATRYSPNLNVTSGNEYYIFSVAAYNAQHELVGDFSNFYRNGSDGWFEFKLVSKPD